MRCGKGGGGGGESSGWEGGCDTYVHRANWCVRRSDGKVSECYTTLKDIEAVKKQHKTWSWFMLQSSGMPLVLVSVSWQFFRIRLVKRPSLLKGVPQKFASSSFYCEKNKQTNPKQPQIKQTAVAAATTAIATKVFLCWGVKPVFSPHLSFFSFISLIFGQLICERQFKIAGVIILSWCCLDEIWYSGGRRNESLSSLTDFCLVLFIYLFFMFVSWVYFLIVSSPVLPVKDI